MSGHLYLILLREFVKAQGHVVLKFGRSSNVVRRYKQYPKGSILMWSQFVDNFEDQEQRIINILIGRFIQRVDIGREYFQGAIADVIRVVHESIEIAPTDQVTDRDESIAILTKTHELCDPDLIVHAFMDRHKTVYNNRVVKSIEVYDQFQAWVLSSPHITKNISHKRMSSALKEGYGVVTKPYRFDDGVSAAIAFGEMLKNKTVESTAINERAEIDPYVEFLTELYKEHAIETNIMRLGATQLLSLFNSHLAERHHKSPENATAFGRKLNTLTGTYDGMIIKEKKQCVYYRIDLLKIRCCLGISEVHTDTDLVR